MRMPWKNDPGIVSMIIAGFMTLLGTIASYAYRVLQGEPFRWTTLILQFFISIFAGSLMYMAAYHYGWPPEMSGGACGLAGWSGSSVIKALERRLLGKIDIGDSTLPRA